SRRRARIDSAGAHHLLALAVGQVGTEVEHRIQDVVALEIGRAAVEVDEPPGKESTFLEEHEPDAPCSAFDGLLAAAALGLTARRALSSVDPRQAPVRRAAARRTLEGRAIGHTRWRFRERLEHRL